MVNKPRTTKQITIVSEEKKVLYFFFSVDKVEERRSWNMLG